MLVDEIARPIVEVLYIRCVRQGTGRMLHTVESLRIEALPPLIFALRLGKMAIIWNAHVWAGLVGAV